MVTLIYNTPSFLLFILICLFCIIISFIAVTLVHKYVPLKFRYDENQATVCVSALLSIIYAVLVGFIILYELNNFNNLQDAEKEEAKALFTVYRNSMILPEPTNMRVRNHIINYANNAIKNEWPAMSRGAPISNIGVNIIEDISKEIRSFTNLDKLDGNVIQALNQMSINNNDLFDSHQQRILKIHTALTANIWFVIILGSFLTLAVNFMLGMELRFHMICVTFISLMIAAVLYLIITLDRPYRGDFSIKPITFIATLQYIMHKPNGGQPTDHLLAADE